MAKKEKSPAKVTKKAVSKPAEKTKAVVAKKVAGQKLPEKVDVKNQGKLPGIYADTWNKPNIKAGLYLDTWMPPIDVKPNTAIYLDTWLPAAVLARKGKKPGIYADTWLPADAIKIKQRRGK